MATASVSRGPYPIPRGETTLSVWGYARLPQWVRSGFGRGGGAGGRAQRAEGRRQRGRGGTQPTWALLSAIVTLRRAHVTEAGSAPAFRPYRLYQPIGPGFDNHVAGRHAKRPKQDFRHAPRNGPNSGRSNGARGGRCPQPQQPDQRLRVADLAGSRASRSASGTVHDLDPLLLARVGRLRRTGPSRDTDAPARP